MVGAGGPVRAIARGSALLRVLAWLLLAVAIVCFLFALLLAGMRCDESCAQPGEPLVSWNRSPDAWQWTAQAILAGVALGLAGFGVTRAAARWRAGVIGAAALLLGAWAALAL